MAIIVTFKRDNGDRLILVNITMYWWYDFDVGLVVGVEFVVVLCNLYGGNDGDVILMICLVMGVEFLMVFYNICGDNVVIKFE